ncbi:hypothetical protein [Flavobacterium silvaticum]|uniref:Uncharacterized protein n=1 Tax=Flavobacterium silvaticum TaxID=1852020 RepID=A0A972FMD6_9FLAO|nr:hypothetical protein [Flavobacterium silvaticum]NMH28681.1 hypothetical protein [Flavobacterium silvaticum]
MEKVGIVFSSRPDVLNSVGLREKWNALLKNRNDSISVNPVIIRKSIDDETNRPYYFLFAQSEDSRLKMAQLLYREKRDLYIDAKEPEIVICDCEDYSPRRVDGKWVCYSAEGGNECELEVIAAENKRTASR